MGEFDTDNNPNKDLKEFWWDAVSQQRRQGSEGPMEEVVQLVEELMSFHEAPVTDERDAQ